jgi:hypothetical protein
VRWERWIQNRISARPQCQERYVTKCRSSAVNHRKSRDPHSCLSRSGCTAISARASPAWSSGQSPRPTRVSRRAHMLRPACGYKLANNGHDTRAISVFRASKYSEYDALYRASAAVEQGVPSRLTRTEIGRGFSALRLLTISKQPCAMMDNIRAQPAKFHLRLRAAGGRYELHETGRSGRRRDDPSVGEG